MPLYSSVVLIEISIAISCFCVATIICRSVPITAWSDIRMYTQERQHMQHQDPASLLFQFLLQFLSLCGDVIIFSFSFKKQFPSSKFNIQRKASQVTASTLCGDSGIWPPVSWALFFVSSSLLSFPFLSFSLPFLSVCFVPRGFHPYIGPLDSTSLSAYQIS